MSVMNNHHHKAMDLAASGVHERMRGNHKGATKFFAEALDFELKALSELKAPIQPTHSVLHRSATTLALDCGELRHAEKLAAKALAEEPPEEIAEELRDVMRQVHSRTRVEPPAEGALADEREEYGAEE